MDAKGRTNHHLFYAQTLIKEILSPHRNNQGPLNQALLSSACLQLRECWASWLAELGQIIKADLSLEAFTGIAQNNQSTDSHSVINPELQFILDGAREGWLKDLRQIFEDPIEWLAVYQQSSTGSRQLGSEQVRNDGQGVMSIALVDVDAQKKLSAEQVMQSLLKELKAYIQSVRDRQTEW